MSLVQAPQTSEERETGLSILGPMPWSTHVSLFYETNADLLDTILPFFEAGLRAGELCVWLPAKPSLATGVRDGLRERLPDFDDRLARNEILFLPTDEFFLPGGSPFTPDTVLARWQELIERAAGNGFTGLRGAGDQSWLVERDWPVFYDFEQRLHELIKHRCALLMCTYPLGSYGATELLDSARAHHVVIARRHGTWQVLETPSLKQTKEQIQRANEILEHRVAERTRELARSQARLAKTRRAARERALEARFAAALEERTRLAREIHDSLLQGVTGIALQLRAVLPRLKGASAAARRTIGDVVELAESTIRDARQAVWDMRSPSLVHKGLPAALEEAVGRAARTLEVHFEVAGKTTPLRPEVEDAIFRIGREAVVNAARHAKAHKLDVRLTYKPRSVTLTVSDDGRGFDVKQTVQPFAGRWGLLGMRERADRIGGSLRIRSAPDHGTTIELRIPLRSTGRGG